MMCIGAWGLPSFSNSDLRSLPEAGKEVNATAPILLLSGLTRTRWPDVGLVAAITVRPKSKQLLRTQFLFSVDADIFSETRKVKARRQKY